MNHQVIYNILSGNISDKEKGAFYEEIKQDVEKRNEFIYLKNIWDLNSLSQIKSSPNRKRYLFRKFWKSTQFREQRTVSQIITNWGKYAAIIILALLAGFYLNSLVNEPTGAWKQFHAQSGSISSVMLEDGSKIWLNANTTLSLNEQRGKVIVKLKGEAFFEIVHDKKRIFIVDLGKIKIQDVGTSFNISAYPKEEFYRATLVEGKIDVLDAEGHEIRKLDINETFRFNPVDNTYKIEELDPLLVTGWTENKFVFINKSLAEICLEIEKWYGVSIIIKGENLKQGIYTSVIRRPSTVKQLLEMFKLTTGIDYKIEEPKDKQTIIYLN